MVDILFRGRYVAYLGENILTLSQKQYPAQRTSKVLIKAFQGAIFILLFKLGPSVWA